MTLIVILLPVLLVLAIALYRNHRDTTALPRVPLGADTDRVSEEIATLTRQSTW